MMMEFLSFERFISTGVLIIFYYMGAIVMPVIIFISGKRLSRKSDVNDEPGKSGKGVIWNSLTGRQKIKTGIAVAACFIAMELLWRMVFEFLIAYMQIRDAMLQVQL